MRTARPGAPTGSPVKAHQVTAQRVRQAAVAAVAQANYLQGLHGTVTAVGSSGTVTVRLAGSATPTAGIKHQASYMPKVTDHVVCALIGTDLWVMGGYGANPIHSLYTARSTSGTAVPNEVTTCTAAITVTLPTSPPAGTTNVVIAHGGTVTISRGGSNVIFWPTSKTTIAIATGMAVTLVWSGGSWRVTALNGIVPDAQLYPTAATAVTNTATTTVTFALAGTSNLFGGMVKTGNAIKVPIAGSYLVEAQASIVISTGGLFQMHIAHTGAGAAIGQQPNNALGTVVSATAKLTLTAGALITVTLHQTSSTASVNTFGATPVYGFLTATWLHP